MFRGQGKGVAGDGKSFTSGVHPCPARGGTSFAIPPAGRVDRARKLSAPTGTGYRTEELRAVLLTTRGGASYLDPLGGERREADVRRASLTFAVLSPRSFVVSRACPPQRPSSLAVRAVGSRIPLL